MFKDIITSSKELEELIVLPGKNARSKIIDHLDSHCINFIEHSPFWVLATANLRGHFDASPRGDQPGFVKVLGPKHLVIPDRRGNNHLDSVQNILDNPGIGVLFFIPGLGETLRVNGYAKIIKDEHLLSTMAVNGIQPKLGIGIEVTECYLQCGKAIIRSGLWNVHTWEKPGELPNPAEILSAHMKLDDQIPDMVEKRLQEGIEKDCINTRKLNMRRGYFGLLLNVDFIS